jgi:hypothetical protein
MDVSGDDCTASSFVYDRPPPRGGDTIQGTPFINDGCYGERIFLGIGGERRELRRNDGHELGEGGAYSDDEYVVLVKRGRMVRRVVIARPPDADCPSEGEVEYDVTYAAEVQVWSRSPSWKLNGTLWRTECAR